MGYPLNGTGYFGAQTETAVETFQRLAGLHVDGVVGPETAKAIDAASNASGKQIVAGKPVATLAEVRAPLWLATSLAHVGLREGAGAKNNPELVGDIRTVAKDYQNDSTPWCAGWVSFCLVKAGEKPSTEPLWALSYSDVKNQPVVKLPDVALGAIMVKTRNGGGHVTMVAGRTRSGALACCGGNQNDSVSVAPYAKSAFVGAFWPKGAPLPTRYGMESLPIVDTLGKPLAVSEA